MNTTLNNTQNNGAAKFAPIYDHSNTTESYDAFNGGVRVLLPVLFMYQGRRRFVVNLTEEYKTREQTGKSYENKMKESRDDVAEYFRQLNQNDGKYFCFYCCDWGTRERDIYKFLEWIAANGYTFDNNMTHIIEGDEYTDFNGNLNEYSAAFFFRIYNKELAADIMARCQGVRIYDENGNQIGPQSEHL